MRRIGIVVARAVERERLLVDAANDLAACASKVSQPMTLALTLQLDESGAIDFIAPESDDPIRACVDAALRSAADFAPPPDAMSRDVPVRVALAPQ